jgi:hypothetical protein
MRKFLSGSTGRAVLVVATATAVGSIASPVVPAFASTASHHAHSAHHAGHGQTHIGTAEKFTRGPGGKVHRTR